MAAESKVDIPQMYICPITHMVMTDPYVDADGNSYEKDAIFNWVRTNPVSPITRNPLQMHQLVPNRVLKEIIEASGLINLSGAKGDAKGAKDANEVEKNENLHHYKIKDFTN
jgi:hypothetical protein